MLRLLIGSGLLLMAVGFGAAGWQYWQGLPGTAAEPSADDQRDQAAPPLQTWLMSPTGALVPRADVRAYLLQDRLVQGRAVTITRTARLNDLLIEGEKLPEPPYLEVLADIRAPGIADALCPVLTSGFARTCAVNAARVVEGSVDEVLGTARFRIELVYRQTPEETALPDLASHVLHVRSLPLDLSADPAAQGSAEAALAAALLATEAGCAAEGGLACRVLDLSLDWTPGLPPRAVARLAWLAPLPEGMFIAPTLDTPPPEG
jgi:hypothetical protein